MFLKDLIKVLWLYQEIEVYSINYHLLFDDIAIRFCQNNKMWRVISITCVNNKLRILINEYVKENDE